MTHAVFVSYAEKDISVAEAVVAGLENKGVTCWIAPRDIPPGDSFVAAVVSAIKSSKIMVVILSGNSNDKQVVKQVEIAVADNLTLIPFRIEDISPSGAMAYLLNTEHWLDAFTRPVEDHLDKLIEMLLREVDIESRPAIAFTEADSEHAENELNVVDSFDVHGATTQSQIQFCVGDLTKAKPEDSVDVLVVWTVRDSYFPIPGSLIGALHQEGVDIETLAEDKEVDLRQAFSCWLSHQLHDPPPGIQFKRILCYEPEESASASEHVGDIFRSLAPFLGGTFPVRTVATPLLASGFQRQAKIEMLQQLVEASVHWMSSGLPLNCLKIVCLPDDHIDELTRLFAELKSHYSDLSLQRGSKFSYDLFISYSHKDAREVLMFEDTLLAQQNDLRIFIDRKNLNSGAAWQREIFEAIDDSRKVAVFYSPTYLDSKVCIEEFNIALCRHRESDESVMLPIYLYSANLPTYMRLVQFIDCREFNPNKLNDAALELIGNINS